MTSNVVPISTDIVDIPVPEMFASADWRVISRKGEYYYLSCGEVVVSNDDGSTTICVKPKHHPTWEHEDFEGRTREADIKFVADLDYRTRNRARNVLMRTGLNDEQVFNALNALFYDGVKLVKEI